MSLIQVTLVGNPSHSPVEGAVLVYGYRLSDAKQKLVAFYATTDSAKNFTRSGGAQPVEVADKDWFFALKAA